MFRRVLVANRGVIACRIMRTLLRMGVEPVAVYSEADAGAPHVAMAAEAVCVGPAAAAQSYLNVSAILQAAHATGSAAIHPGYGFLSENPDFADACEGQGTAFIGPTSAQIRAFGLKNTARDIAVACGTPILPGTGLLADVSHALDAAKRIGFPVMLKSAAGGGGIGMRLCSDETALAEAFESVRRLSESHFKGSGIYLERFVAQARHIEVQVFGDGCGPALALGERDCSVQRRNQKIIEETPAPGLSIETRRILCDAAVRIMQSVSYRSAGTVEFLFDTQSQDFYFLEVNTRLQVEHGVTEEVLGIDLVEWMVRLAAGDLPPLSALSPTPKGAAIQVRIYAEDPLDGFQPSSGRITNFTVPPDCRVERWISTGSEVTPYYDPLLAKLIVHAETREAAIGALHRSLEQTNISGIATNLDFLRAVVADHQFSAGAVTTSFLSGFTYQPNSVRVLAPGIQTTVQQYPGRLGFWDVGVPPSGPMDALSFRLGNSLLGNPPDAAGLECTLSGPSLYFYTGCRIAITGTDMRPMLNGSPAPLWTIVSVPASATLELGSVQGPGARCYILFEGGLVVPAYLDSAATFTLGNFGGHAGRQLRASDLLTLAPRVSGDSKLSSIPADRRPSFTTEWDIGVLCGPHGAPDFFTPDDIDALFATAWTVHHNSSRTGVRLIGPKPRWARADGGDAGLHPSNIHDNAYGIGAIDFTGDMPVILGPDGPSLGGFVCPAVVVDAELWKIGQLSPGNVVRFRPLSLTQATSLESAIDLSVATLHDPLPHLPPDQPIPEPAVLQRDQSRDFVCRASGDKYLLIEFGQAVLDLTLRFRAHALMEALRSLEMEGVIDLTPGIRSLQIHYDSRILTRERLLRMVDETIANLPALDDTAVPARIVHLPLSWDDPATRLAISRYMASVRPDAPWCPSNLEFIRRVNGLSSIDDVHRIAFEANYLVLGLGDVYLGAPVATPVDPRHRLVTTKYNPARTWTPENAVGIGGAYLCVYGMEGPGGYQFVGRTLQMWNTYPDRAPSSFEPDKPWLLRFFDQIRFYPVEADELLEIRRDFLVGRFQLRMEPDKFRLNQHINFLQQNEASIAQFRSRQQEAFAEERARWADLGEFTESIADEPLTPAIDHDVPDGCLVLRAPATASVWRFETEPGKQVEAGQRAVLLEAMKMEIVVSMPHSAEVVSVLCRPGAIVTTGQPLLTYRPTSIV